MHEKDTGSRTIYVYFYCNSRLARYNLSKECVVSCLKILNLLYIEFLTIKNYLLKSLYLAFLMIKLEISNVVIMIDYSLAVVFPKIYPGHTYYQAKIFFLKSASLLFLSISNSTLGIV